MFEKKEKLNKFINLITIVACAIVNATCEKCLIETCYFCNEDQTCRPLKFDGIFPSGCKSSESRWLSCSSK